MTLILTQDVIFGEIDMHISEVERMRLEKEHKMRNGYQDHDNKKFPHLAEEMSESQYLYKDLENKHAKEMKMEDM